MIQRPRPTEPLCDRPPPGVFYLDLRVPSSQKGGTKIADEVMDWEAHLQRLETVDGYRPALCDHCGCRRLHGHGRRVRVLAGDDLMSLEIRRYRCVECGAVWQVLPGMHLHAATTVDGCDRKRLERVCRYLLRPPFAYDAVQALPDGRVRVFFKAPGRSGAAHADMTTEKLLARLCALVPPTGFHMNPLLRRPRQPPSPPPPHPPAVRRPRLRPAAPPGPR